MNDTERARELLAAYRASIDNIDAAIVHMLAERFRVTDAVGVLKARHELPPQDPAREQAQAERLAALCAQAGLDLEFAHKIHRFIVDEATSNHRVIAARLKSET